LSVAPKKRETRKTEKKKSRVKRHISNPRSEEKRVQVNQAGWETGYGEIGVKACNAGHIPEQPEKKANRRINSTGHRMSSSESMRNRRVPSPGGEKHQRVQGGDSWLKLETKKKKGKPGTYLYRKGGGIPPQPE